MICNDKVLNAAVQKIKQNIRRNGSYAMEYPASKNGIYFDAVPRELRHVFSWTQGFYTGLAGLAYIISDDREFLKWLYSLGKEFQDKVTVHKYDTMHDLGFIYSLYAVMMYKITGDENMKQIGLQAADCLTMRYVPNGRYIKAWGRMDGKIPEYVDSELAKDTFFARNDGLMIIDCMMNLPLLFWATEVTGHPFYADIAKSHIDTAVKYLVREDYSVYHAYRFDPVSGEPVCPDNDCGYSVDSYWARGMSWMIYGLVIAYKYTHNEEYLNLFEKVTHSFISHCTEDGMPVWDFFLPEHEMKNIDTSAAAVVCCGISCYSRYRSDAEFEDYRRKALTSLKEKYFDSSMDTEGLVSNSNGRNEYTIYGDYYFLEAIMLDENDMEIFW